MTLGNKSLERLGIRVPDAMKALSDALVADVRGCSYDLALRRHSSTEAAAKRRSPVDRHRPGPHLRVAVCGGRGNSIESVAISATDKPEANRDALITDVDVCIAARADQ